MIHVLTKNNRRILPEIQSNQNQRNSNSTRQKRVKKIKAKDKIQKKSQKADLIIKPRNHPGEQKIKEDARHD